MNEKNCAFQYATPYKIYEDTELITREEADELWAKYKPIFVQHMIDGLEPEMALWINMKNGSDYHTDEKHLHCDDCTIRDGKLFVRESV